MELRKGDVVFYCVVLFGFWASVSASLADVTVISEAMALKDVMESLKGYDFGISDDDYCREGSGVNCSSGHVIALVAPGQPSSTNYFLSGSIPRSIGNLTHLQTLVLSGSNIAGPIPSELGRLEKIETIDLSDNFLTGAIPSSLVNLTRLTSLVLSGNNISGPIPSELGRLEKIETIDLSDNLLTGAIPSSLVNLTRLTFLDLSFNNLSGPVPRLLSETLNVLGNPMICATGNEPECNGTTPMPLSFSSTNSQMKPKILKVALASGTSLGISLLILGLVFLLWWRQKRTQQIFFDMKEQNHEEVCLGNLRMFQFSELQIATNNFSGKNILGKGGFGNVYRGHLEDGSIVAVKRLKDGNAIRGEIQFQTEAEMISLAVHRNILRLYGFCITKTERLLVYPYMSNGSVASRLKAKPPLDWGTRKRIAIGAARGLLYLHEQCDSKIIHRDVKAANILLDDNCEAVVGDFGLAKLLGHCDSHVTTAIRGTVGHIAPEYLSTGQSSEKTDIFGFGIFLLELITGQRTMEFCKAANLKGPMLDWVKKIHQEKRLEMLVDKKLKNNYDSSELEEMAKVALLCTQHDPSHRPKMSVVVEMLQGEGLAEKWEASQSAEATRRKANESPSSERDSDLTNDSSSLLVKAVEILRGWKRAGNL